MPTSPKEYIAPADSQREQTARNLLAYIEQLPMGTEQRLELTLEILRDLPVEATPDQAFDALYSRLPKQQYSAFPPSHPPIKRGHMPSQYMGRPRTGVRGFVAQWAWLLIVGLLLALTLLLNVPQ